MKFFLLSFTGFALLLTASCSIFRLSHSNPYDPFGKNADPGALTAFFPFNGNALDESGNGHHGTVVNAVLTNDRFNNVSNAYYFNGTSGYISSLFQISSNRNFTVLFWIKDLSSGNTYRRWITTTLGVLTPLSIMAREMDAANNGGCQIYAGTQYLTSTNYSTNREFWKDGNWHMFAYVSDGSASKLFYDGTNVISITNTVVPEYGFYIGGFYTGSGQEYFYGMMDDIRVLGVPLSDAEILSYFHENGW